MDAVSTPAAAVMSQPESAGAVRAAAWLVGKPPGLYRIEEVLGLDV